ncbi:MAG: leucyl aminopeptidase family protein, partial [Tabrizicola sp.]|nr:leucyl aminopeptidase family protein [Tabrizicola sp.]
MTLAFADPSPTARSLHVLRPEELSAFLAGPGASWSAWLQATGFDAALGELRLLPAPDGGIAGAVAGY